MKRVVAIILVGMMLIGSISFATETYTVQSGDVLWKIAQENKTSVDALVALNKLLDGNKIYTGQVLEVSVIENGLLSNADKAVALIESIGTSNLQAVAYINPTSYTQHNLGVADGISGFAAVVAHLPEGSYGKNIRVFEDGDFVVMHNEYNFFGPKVAFDIFRFEEGLIVEHWDNLTPVASDVNPSGRGQLDGTTLLKDLEKTEVNKTLVSGFVNDVLMGGAPEKITDYVSEVKYFQHNTGVADGLEGLGLALAALAEAGTPMIYTENHSIHGQGNFVLATSEGEFLGEHVAFYDLFRVEDGKIVEHWDVIETIPAEATWMNQNGKF